MNRNIDDIRNDTIDEVGQAVRKAITPWLLDRARLTRDAYESGDEAANMTELDAGFSVMIEGTCMMAAALGIDDSTARGLCMKLVEELESLSEGKDMG